MDPKWARTWFAATALVVAFGVAIEVVLAVQNHPVQTSTGEVTARFGDGGLDRALNVFAFFTIQSNLIVGVTSALLAVSLKRSSTVFGVFRLIGLVAITVTFLVFHVALAGLLDLES
jgi:hypothetical protein